MANPALIPDAVRQQRARAVLVLCCFAASLGLYAITCAPGLLWQDSAMFQYRVLRFNLAGDIGLPLAHPLYIVLAKPLAALPLGDLAFRVNLFSAFCGAIAIALLADLLILLTRNAWAAVIGAISLAVSHTFWMHSVIAEVYNLYTVGLFAELWLVFRFFQTKQLKWLILAALANGLNLSNHLMAILHWPAYVGVLYWGFKERALKPLHLVPILAALAAGSSLYLYLIAAELGKGRPTLDVFREALVGPPHRAKHVLEYSFPWEKQIRNSVIYFGLNFPTPLILLAPIGLAFAWQKPILSHWTKLAGAFFVVAFIFAFRYTVPDQFAFFTPCYALVALFIGLGAVEITRRSKGGRIVCIAFALLPVLVYEAAPRLLRERGISIGLSREIVYRDNYDYFIRPRKNGYRGTERYAREALERAGPSGLIYADTTIINALIFARDIGRVQPDVVLLGAWDIEPDPPKIEGTAEAMWPYVDERRAWSTVPDSNYVSKWIRAQFTTEPDGLLYRIVPKPTGTN